MSSKLPKEFESSMEVLPFTKQGLSTVKEFRNIEERCRALEMLKRAGLSDEEIKLYQDNEAGNLVQHNKIEISIMKLKLDAIYKKIHKFEESTKLEEPSTSDSKDTIPKFQQSSVPIYPKGHPMNEIKELEQNMFGHHKMEAIPSITKRRKMLRRLERKKQRIEQNEHVFLKPTSTVSQHRKLNSKWDLKTPNDGKVDNGVQKPGTNEQDNRSIIVGPQKSVLYTLRDNKIVKVNPVSDMKLDDVRPESIFPDPGQLLEGTKMSVDEIKKYPQFKDYEPGMPSKVLHLKNIEQAVSEAQVSLLFNQFVLDNGGPIHVHITPGSDKNTALVYFQDEDIAIQALEETNGTVLTGSPIVAYFKQDENT